MEATVPYDPVEVRKYDRLKVEIYINKEEMGLAAALRAAAISAGVLQDKSHVNMVFSTGASQFAFVAALQQVGIDWQRVHAYHLDEYVGIAPGHPASFRLWLQQRVVAQLHPASFSFLAGDAPDAEAECRRYADLLRQNPTDLGFIGIGENGHIAFNDPPADFSDPLWVRTVELDQACRRQQVGEGWFPTVDDVPTHALSMTVPAIMACRSIISVVPDQRKAAAVRQTLLGPVDPACPASILRTHSDATLFLDAASAALLA